MVGITKQKELFYPPHTHTPPQGFRRETLFEGFDFVTAAFYCVKSVDSVVGRNTELWSWSITSSHLCLLLLLLALILPSVIFLKGKELDLCGREIEAERRVKEKTGSFGTGRGRNLPMGWRLCTQGAEDSKVAGLDSGLSAAFLRA